MACDVNYGVGIETSDNKNTIPWKISEDMQFFKRITSDVTQDDNSQDNIDQQNKKRKLDEEEVVLIPLVNAIIMGRKTADTLMKVLPNRINVVITSQKDYRSNEGFISYQSLNHALNELSLRKDINKVFVIGGAKLAEEAIQHKRCRRIYLNRIEYDYKCDIKLSDKIISTMNKFYSLTKESKSNVTCKNLNQSVSIIFNNYCQKTNQEEKNYLNLLEKILAEGDFRQTRNAFTYAIFGEKLEFDMDNGFPLLTTKKMFYRGIFEELLFFLRGDTDTKKLEDLKVMIWHENTTKEFIEKNNKKLEEYDMGPMYGFQWRHFGAPYQGCHQRYDDKGIDQLKILIESLVKDPHSRRHLMTTYNPEQMDEGVLPPCHGLIIQFYVEKNNRLSLQMYQR
jgi:dihydrofolate reductase/thymidylate synthase